MRISVIGTGYVGLCAGIGFALKGNNVISVDKDENKVKSINKGQSPIFEEGLDKFLKETVDKKIFIATTDLKKAVINSEISFISVSTPSNQDGSIDVSIVKKVSENIGKALQHKESYHLIAVKSTVIPETTESIIIPTIEKYSGKKQGKAFGACMNPEFMREGKALEDFLKPDRIIIGELDKQSGNLLEKLYLNFDTPIFRTDLKTAEMIKYASNSFLATKISFINEIGNICKKLGIDVYDVAKGIGYDKRISPLFLNAGCGFGGSCFGKDIMALLSKAKELGYEPELINTILNVNRKQPIKLIELLEKKIKTFKNKKIAILGLAFKPGTDDIRDASSIIIIKELLDRGAEISAYDPKAINNMKKLFPDIEYAKNTKEAIKNSSACMILTEWPEFKNLSNKDFEIMKQKIILEGRKILDNDRVTGYEGICW